MHIFGNHLSDAYVYLDRGDIKKAKKELRKISKNGLLVNKELGQLINHSDAFRDYIKVALETDDISSLKDIVTEAQITLRTMIEKIEIILKEEISER